MPPQGGVMERQIARERMDGRGGARPDSGDRLLYVVDQGLHVPGITRIPHGQMQGKDKARRRFGNHARLAAERRGAMAFALANRRNRGIVRVDNFAVGQHLALRQPAGLVCDPLLGREGGGKLGVQARPLVFRQLWHTVQALLHGPCHGQDLASMLQPDFDTSRYIFPDKRRSGLLNCKALGNCRLDTEPQFIDTWMMEIDLTKPISFFYHCIHVSA
jgi:hypothetical protein